MNIDKLRGLMAERNTSYKTMANLLEMSVSGFGKKMRKETHFNIEEVKKIAEFFEVDVMIFMKK